MQKTYEISLPSFIRRIKEASVLKAQILSFGCKLQRKGRSRNWLLIGNFEQLENITSYINSSNETSWLWVATRISSLKKNLSFDELTEIAKKQPNITITQFIKQTDCTVAEARRVLDELEDLI